MFVNALCKPSCTNRPVEEAEANVRDLMMRWFAVRRWRVIESDDPVNYAWVDGKLRACAQAVEKENQT